MTIVKFYLELVCEKKRFLPFFAPLAELTIFFIVFLLCNYLLVFYNCKKC